MPGKNRQTPPRHLLVFRTSAMGDVAMLAHAVRALKSAYPALRVTVATQAIFRPFFAGLAVAARHGFEMENGTQYARDRYVDVNIFDERHREVLARLNRLPASCEESARRLEEHRAVYERHGVFSPRLIDGLVARLAAFRDADLRRELAGDEEKVRKLVETYFYCG